MDKTFVSRGGIKLQAALDQFKIDVTDKIVLDVGSSTGGFVDCLLQGGVSKVYSVDTCYGELAWKLRNDSRVVVMERTNILHLENLPEPVDLITIDAGWTKLELVLPVVKKFLRPSGRKVLRSKFLKPEGIIITLLKPHYEGSKKDLVKGVLPEDLAEQVRDKVIENIKALGFKVQGVMESPILGGEGNREFLLEITVL